MLTVPLPFYQLDEVAEWLQDTGFRQANGRPWTERSVLGLALATYHATLENQPPTCIEAAPPMDTVFGLYRWSRLKKVDPNSIENEEPDVMKLEMNLPWQTIPLYPYQTRQLLICGETTAISAQRSGDVRTCEYVMTRPLGQPVRIQWQMLGITESGLRQLADTLKSLEAASSGVTVNGKRKARWRDERLLDLLRERDSGKKPKELAEIHGISRQRIIELLKKARRLGMEEAPALGKASPFNALFSRNSNLRR